jgi:hypothetical protein
LTRTRLIVVSELVATRDTLLVRLMGAGQVLRKAIAELKALSSDAPERVLALPILLRLRLEMPADPAQRTREDEEFFMSTQDIVESLIQQGRNEGRNEGLIEALLALYEARFGTPPADLSEAIHRTRDPATLRDWLQMIGTRSADDVAAVLRASMPR